MEMFLTMVARLLWAVWRDTEWEPGVQWRLLVGDITPYRVGLHLSAV